MKYLGSEEPMDVKTNLCDQCSIKVMNAADIPTTEYQTTKYYSAYTTITTTLIETTGHDLISKQIPPGFSFKKFHLLSFLLKEKLFCRLA